MCVCVCVCAVISSWLLLSSSFLAKNVEITLDPFREPNVERRGVGRGNGKKNKTKKEHNKNRTTHTQTKTKNQTRTATDFTKKKKTKREQRTEGTNKEEKGTPCFSGCVCVFARTEMKTWGVSVSTGWNTRNRNGQNKEWPAPKRKMNRTAALLGVCVCDRERECVCVCVFADNEWKGRRGTREKKHHTRPVRSTLTDTTMRNTNQLCSTYHTILFFSLMMAENETPPSQEKT